MERMLVSVVGASALTSLFDLNLFGGDPLHLTGGGIMLAVGALVGARMPLWPGRGYHL
jgi:hypothetical protein